MRLVERRRLIKKTRAAVEAKVSQVVLTQLQSRYRSLKRELRKGNLRKRLRKFEKAVIPANPSPPPVQPGADGWQDWIDAFSAALTEALMEGADQIGSIENEIWASRGMPQYIVDPAKVVEAYQARTGRQITNIGQDTQDAVLQAIADWKNTDAGLGTLLEDLGQYFDDKRASLIAATETAYVTSQIASDQMAEYGINKWIWDAFDDWLTCPECEDLNGQVFDRGDDEPPLHPNCRCTMLFADDEGMEMVLPTGNMRKDWSTVERDEHGRWTGPGNTAAEQRERKLNVLMRNTGNTPYDIADRQALKATICSQLGDTKNCTPEEADEILRDWAQSSTDGNSAILQAAAANTFGIPINEYMQNQINNVGFEIQPSTQDVIKGVALAINNNTQEWLAKEGFSPDDKITLYRGVHLADSSLTEGQQITAQLNPLSSWSADEYIAQQFSYNDEKTSSYVLKADVPVSQIFSTAMSGAGCVTENEVIVKGLDTQATIVFAEQRDQAAISDLKDAVNTASANYLAAAPGEAKDAAGWASIAAQEAFNAGAKIHTSPTTSYAPGAFYHYLKAAKKKVFIDDEKNANWPQGDKALISHRPSGTAGGLPAIRTDGVGATPRLHKDWSTVSRDDHGRWEAGGAEVHLGVGNKQIGSVVNGKYPVDEIHDASDLMGNYNTVFVGLMGDVKGKIIGTKANVEHARMLAATDFNANVDYGVRFSDDQVKDEEHPGVYVSGYSVNTDYAGIIVGNSEDEAGAFDNIFRACGTLLSAGLPVNTPLLIQSSQGRLVTTVHKALEPDGLKKWAEDTDRDEHGRWSGGGGSSPAKDLAASRFAADSKLEPGITSSLQGIADANGMKMAGLEWRQKTEESMARKIDENAKEKGITQEEAATQITDSLRYTMLLDPNNFGANFASIQDQLKASGYERYDHKFTNYFSSTGPYRGLNTVWKSVSTGAKFELQFHTAESLALKDANHVIYEKFRVSDDLNACVKMYDQMVGNYSGFSAPTGAMLLR